MNARDSLDGVAVTVKVAVSEFGAKKVARRLRYLAEALELHGALPGVQLAPAPEGRDKNEQEKEKRDGQSKRAVA